MLLSGKVLVDYPGKRMKKPVRPSWPAPSRPDSARQAEPVPSEKPMSRITLALLDEYVLEMESQGYDPYNATIPPGKLRRPRR
jgi:hypothetical protein